MHAIPSFIAAGAASYFCEKIDIAVDKGDPERSWQWTALQTNHALLLLDVALTALGANGLLFSTLSKGVFLTTPIILLRAEYLRPPESDQRDIDETSEVSREEFSCLEDRLVTHLREWNYKLAIVSSVVLFILGQQALGLAFAAVWLGDLFEHTEVFSEGGESVYRCAKATAAFLAIFGYAGQIISGPSLVCKTAVIVTGIFFAMIRLGKLSDSGRGSYSHVGPPGGGGFSSGTYVEVDSYPRHTHHHHVHHHHGGYLPPPAPLPPFNPDVSHSQGSASGGSWVNALSALSPSPSFNNDSGHRAHASHAQSSASGGSGGSFFSMFSSNPRFNQNG